jgi:hypothetical protein
MLKPKNARKPVVAGLIIAVIVFLIDNGLEYLLLRNGSSQWHTLLLSDAFTALVVGIFATYTFKLHRQREIEVHGRVERIVEMNHHVRNALQVIAYWSLAERDKKEVDMIKQAVDRIEWALREVLPRGLGTPPPKFPAESVKDTRAAGGSISA